MELTRDDLKLAAKVFDLLDLIAALDGIETANVDFTAGGQNFTVGYGEAGEAAITWAHPVRS